MTNPLVQEAKQVLDDVIDPIEAGLARVGAALDKLDGVPVIGDDAKQLAGAVARVRAEIAAFRAKIGVPDDVGGDAD